MICSIYISFASGALIISFAFGAWNNCFNNKNSCIKDVPGTSSSARITSLMVTAAWSSFYAHFQMKNQKCKSLKKLQQCTHSHMARKARSQQLNPSNPMVEDPPFATPPCYLMNPYSIAVGSVLIAVACAADPFSLRSAACIPGSL